MSPLDSQKPFHVRAGTLEDLASVHALIVELAVYEKAPNEVSLSLDQLVRDAAEGCFFWTVAALEDSTIIGVALHHAKYSTWKGKTWHLEDLVVTEKWRGFGVGKALFSAVVETANGQGAQRLEWQVLDWNEPAIGFYKKLEAALSSEWLNGRLTKAQLESYPTQSTF